MRSVLTFLFIAVFGLSFSQVTIYSENFGSTPSFVSVSTYNGYQHYGVVSYTGSASVRNTLPSTGYAGASGNANVFFTNIVGTNLTISGINTYCYLFAFLSVGIWKSTTASNGSEFVIEYSDNGGPWIQMPLTLPTGTGTAIWRNVTLSDPLPLTTNLSLRFRQTSSAGVQFRIDDINVAGIQNTSDSLIQNCTGFFYGGQYYSEDSLYTFVETDYRGCDSIVRIEYIYDQNDPGCILPIELSSFNAVSESQSIRIQWTTLSEYQSDYFVLEKLDGDWKDINRQNAAGYSSQPRNYFFYDTETEKELNYYRLKQVDYDGSFTYSKIILHRIVPLIERVEYYDLMGRKVDRTILGNFYIEVRESSPPRIFYRLSD